jgi:hypothetical protein
MPSEAETELAEAMTVARQYIDDVIEIYRRHGMANGGVPEDVYEEAIRDVVRAASELRAAARR